MEGFLFLLLYIDEFDVIFVILLFLIVYYFYNYHVNRFILVENNTVGKIRDTNLERNILLKFTFEEGSLVSWEEDKLTLAMSMKNRPRSSSMLKYFSYLLNIILAIQLSNS